MFTKAGAPANKQNPYLVKIVRFTVGVTTALVLSSTFQWPLAFVAPIFVGMFLGLSGVVLNLKTIRLITLGVAGVLSIGLVIAISTAHIPVLCLLLVFSGLYWAYYLGNIGSNPLLVMMMMVGLSIIPMMGVNFRDLALGFTLGFVFNLFLALMLAWLCNSLFPNPHQTKPNAIKENEKAPPIDTALASRNALISTIVVSPLLLYFYVFNDMGNVLVLCFAVLFLQNPNALSSIKTSLITLRINAVGCLYAAISMVVLNLVPGLLFFSVVMGIVCLHFATRIFLSDRGAAYASALNPVLILIGSTIVSDPAAFDHKMWLRLLQISCVPVYFACMFQLIRVYFPQAARRSKMPIGQS